MDKYLKTRMVQKADTAENWAKINDFCPLLGEIVVYLFEEENLIKIKIGDGKTLIQDLPFLKGEIDTTITPDLTDIQQQIDSLMESKASKEEASSESAGLMSPTDKIKLDGLKNYELPMAGKELGGVKTTSNVSDISNYSATPIVDGIPYFKETVTDTSLSKAGFPADAAEVGDLFSRLIIKHVTEKGTNIDDYKTQGIYYITSATYAPTGLPNNAVNGWLIVLTQTESSIKDGVLRMYKQIFMRSGTVNNTDKDFYYRLGKITVENVESWGDWYRVLNNKDLDTTLTKENFVPDAKATGEAINARVLKSNTGEARILVGSDKETQFRFAVTTAGNLRVDKSVDSGATWETFYYALSNAGGTFEADAVRYKLPGSNGAVAFCSNDTKNGAGIWLYGNDHSTGAGKFRLQVCDAATGTYHQLDGAPNGTLTWDNHKVYTEADTIPFAATAAQLVTDCEMQVDLGSNSAPTFNGMAPEIRLGVNGTLLVANGGTGGNTPEQARKILGISVENIGAAKSEHVHAAEDITSGILPIERGGTGKGTANEATINLFSGMKESDTAVNDNNLLVFRYTDPGSNGVFTYKKALTIWTWLQSKLLESNVGVKTLTLGSTAGEAHITFLRDGRNYLVAPDTDKAEMAFAFGGATGENTSIVINSTSIYPNVKDTYTSGTREKPWRAVYANNFVGTTARHYAFRKTFYVNGSVTTTGNGEEDSPFQTIDEAFNMMNKGYPNLGIVIQAAGDYKFTQRSFVGMCLHISKKSGIGEVNLICNDGGLVAFYSSHINSDGINWYGQFAEPTSTRTNCQPLYFEGCAVTIKDGIFGPRLQLFGGNLVATNITTPCVYLSYCFAKLDGLTVKPSLLNNANEAERTIRDEHVTRLFFTYLTNIYCASSIHFDFTDNKLSKLAEVHHVDSGTFRIMNTFSESVPSGLYSKFYRTTIYNPKNSANTTDHKTILSNNVTIAENAVTWVNEK